ncbi:olfactory receptor 6B1-like [Crotalus tigris]|uniref:olfactory receptor 6B1-like n=1 Tax=Crotalus tigris TaxID=88082 RepID=UPI00192F3E60|nr:olfactory receptor 6B1-like [Crotalus tigris]XP_039213825.1 olfactory receptor 6B1-like [Crotalus tigris]XP_039213826.1 olfactory receptor 6B1-like [Crotalus tigris]
MQEIHSMWNTEKGNQSSITKFLLEGFGNVPELQPLLFLFFLIIYLATVIGNLLIILLVIADHHLHTPMYFFLANLSCLETCYSSIILPQTLANLFSGQKSISFTRCMTQFYLFGSCVSIETYLLASMSFDRYLAICKPLLYAIIMNKRLCFQLIAATWTSSIMGSGIVMCLMAQLSFCGPNIIDHYFCDFFPVVKLSCSDTKLLELVTFILTFLFTIAPFLLTLISYFCIIENILKISSTTEKRKVFSNCSSHLMVVGIFYSTVIIVYMLPNIPILRQFNKVFSVFYTVLTPLINPLIYSLRNKEVHKAFKRLWCKMIHFKDF